jgi:hypothetical protein
MSAICNQVCNNCQLVNTENAKLRREVCQTREQLEEAEAKIIVMQQEIEQLERLLAIANAKLKQLGEPAVELTTEAIVAKAFTEPKATTDVEAASFKTTDSMASSNATTSTSKPERMSTRSAV